MESHEGLCPHNLLGSTCNDILGMHMCTNASQHGALGVILVEVTVTNDISKSYLRELSVINDIPKE